VSISLRRVRRHQRWDTDSQDWQRFDTRGTIELRDEDVEEFKPILVLHDLIEAGLLDSLLTERGLPHVMVSYRDSAYDETCQRRKESDTSRHRRGTGSDHHHPQGLVPNNS
jgi:hypothetical protein